MRIRNISKDIVIACNALLANNKFKRALGLTNKTEFEDFDGLILYPCSQIHSMGMAFSFDAVFLDKYQTVIHTVESIEPDKVLQRVEYSEFVIELPTGTVKNCSIEIGDMIEIV